SISAGAETKTPKFSSSDSLRAEANAGKTEVPQAPAPRSADASIARVERKGSMPDLSAALAASQRAADPAPAAKAESIASAPEALSAQASMGGEEAVVEGDAAIGTVADSETTAAAPARTSQLTIGALIGLLAGIAGMLGLSWWRRKERQHYAAEKND